MLVSGSAGYWRGIFDGLRPDVALLSLGGRPNVDGEPFQGSSVQYMLEQVQLLRPGRVAFCHHDALYPGLPRRRHRAGRRRAPGAGRPDRLLHARVRHARPALRLTLWRALQRSRSVRRQICTSTATGSSMSTRASVP